MELFGERYASVWCFYVEFVGCVYAVVGIKSMELLGAKYAVVGCMYAETFGCMYAVVGCISDSG